MRTLAISWARSVRPVCGILPSLEIRIDAEALKWYRKAAEQGNADAQNNLGFMYLNGYGVPQDNVQAHMWFNLAAAQGNEVGRENSDFIAEKMTPADISKAQAMAREWLEKHQE